MSRTLSIPLPAGLAEAVGVEALGALWDRPAEASGDSLSALLLHGAGTGIEHPTLEALARGLAQAGQGVLRLRLPFMERIAREGRRRPPDPVPRCVAALRSALEFIASNQGSELLDMPRATQRVGCPVLIGRSLGARVASLAVAEGQTARGLVWLGFPLHPPGKPERAAERSRHFETLDLPILAIQGTRDGHAERGRFTEAVARLPGPKRLDWIEGADHGLWVSRLGSDLDVWTSLAQPIAGWIEDLP